MYSKTEQKISVEHKNVLFPQRQSIIITCRKNKVLTVNFNIVSRKFAITLTNKDALVPKERNLAYENKKLQNL